MRWQLGFIFILLGSVIGGYLYLDGIPYRKYSQWLSGEGFDRYYDIPGFKPLYLTPPGLDKIPVYQEDYVQLWKEFPVRNTLIPLPVRHPLYQSVPIIESTSKNAVPQLGMIFLDPAGREVSRLYTFPNRIYQDHSQGQDLFKLPFFRNRIYAQSLDKIWKDLFTYKIELKHKPLDEMIYDLYLLHLRSKLLPKQTIRYGLINEGKQALIELDSNDKDYKIEIIMTQDSGILFSYLIKTELQRPESLKLRSKFLNSITFTAADESIGRLLYTEFKQLNYARQVDQEGMLYLFSDWSQNTSNVELIKEMIYFLERGRSSKRQLKTLYTYAFKRYGKTFTSRADVEDQDDPDLVLQRRIELEERDLRREAELSKNKIPEGPELTPDEKMNLYLKKAKEGKPKESEDMTVH